MTDEPSEEQKAYEARLQRRLQVLKKQFADGKIFINKGLEVIESLKRVRYAPDGTVDLSTVDGLVRSLALAAEVAHDRQELKESASLAEIQQSYFGFLERNFGDIHREARSRGASPQQVATAISKTPPAVAELSTTLDEVLKTIEVFWSTVGPIAIAHVEDMPGVLKGVFGGDLFPFADENIASKCSLYADTLVLPDPFLRSKHIFEKESPERRIYYLVKHALNILQYRDLACAEVSPPIVAVLPDISALSGEEKDFFYRLGQEDAVVHGQHVFGHQFASFDEMLDYCGRLDSVERAVAAIKDPERVLFDTEWQGSLTQQLKRATRDRAYTKLLGTENPGIILASQALGRMSTCNELLVKARRLGGTPVIEAPTS